MGVQTAGEEGLPGRLEECRRSVGTMDEAQERKMIWKKQCQNPEQSRYIRCVRNI